MELLVFTALGFVVGIALQALLRPSGHEMGTLETSVLGVVGASMGAVFGAELWPYEVLGLHPAGLAGSMLGATCLVLLGDQVAVLKGLAVPYARAREEDAATRQRAADP